MRTRSNPTTIAQFAERVLPGQFAGPSWTAWWAVLRAAFGLPLSPDQLASFRALTGRSAPPTVPARELWAICGRRAGKSFVASLVAVYLATTRTYRLASGERGVLMVIAADRKQARVVRRYVGGLLHSMPVLEQLIGRETAEAVELTNGIVIEVHTASFRTVRGYTVVAAVCDEIAFWPTGEESAEPDREILNALRPAMATVPDSLLLCLSSPYARRGELWRAHRDHYAKDGDPVLVVQAPTRALNPTVPQDLVDRAMAEDPEAGRAEWLGEFRTDVESFVPLDVVLRCVEPGGVELPPARATTYRAFVDPAGGSGKDSFALAIGHLEDADGGVAVIDAVREWRPRFSPEEVVAEAADLLRRYSVRAVTGDRYAGEWPREAFRKRRVDYEVSSRTKSDLYRDALPLLNSGQVELPDEPRLIAQVAGLERRTARGGRDSIDHAPGAHDDLANVALGLAALLTGEEPNPLEGRLVL